MVNNAQAQADDSPMANMEFFLFLADSITQDEELTTPLDIEHIEIQLEGSNSSTQIEPTDTEKEGQNEMR